MCTRGDDGEERLIAEYANKGSLSDEAVTFWDCSLDVSFTVGRKKRTELWWCKLPIEVPNNSRIYLNLEKDVISRN